MTANNATSAQNPLEQVAESMEVILARVHGLVERDGKGVFVQTEKGKALQVLLDNTPPEKREEVVIASLSPKANAGVVRMSDLLKV